MVNADDAELQELRGSQRNPDWLKDKGEYVSPQPGCRGLTLQAVNAHSCVFHQQMLREGGLPGGSQRLQPRH